MVKFTINNISNTALFLPTPMKKILLTIPLVYLSLLSITFAETYTTELQNAYSYAYDIGVTTQWSIGSANMNGSLIRSHMAKMMVNYTKQVLGQQPDTSLACNFSDVANQSSELKGYIIEACQLGLMGVGITAFNPNGVVPRAQFGTVLSRALYGDMYNDGDPYYLFHLQTLQEAGIMTNISNPSASEIRGYVMLMMMRAGGTIQETLSQCTSENQLLCLVDSSNCPAECQTDTASTGTLSLQTNSESYNISDWIHIGALQLSTSSDTITLKNITFQTNAGSATNVKIWLEQDGVRVSPKTAPTSDGTVLLNTSDMQISQWSSVVLHIIVNVALSSLQITNTSSISSSAVSIVGSFPISIY